MSPDSTHSTITAPVEAGTPPLAEIYRVLHKRWGPQHWWPAKTRDEMIIGAVLTQNTAWSNVEQALDLLRTSDALTLERLHALPEDRVATLLQPAGTYRRKAHSLKALAAMLHRQFAGSLDRLLALGTEELRHTLLAVHGIGPETADCILLYAAGRPVFVVDAYTRRMLLRHGWIDEKADYATMAACFERALPGDPKLFGEYHALLVELGKRHCRAQARCAACPLNAWLPAERSP